MSIMLVRGFLEVGLLRWPAPKHGHSPPARSLGSDAFDFLFNFNSSSSNSVILGCCGWTKHRTNLCLSGAPIPSACRLGAGDGWWFPVSVDMTGPCDLSTWSRAMEFYDGHSARGVADAKDETTKWYEMTCRLSRSAPFKTSASQPRRRLEVVGLWLANQGCHQDQRGQMQSVWFKAWKVIFIVTIGMEQVRFFIPSQLRPYCQES